MLSLNTKNSFRRIICSSQILWQIFLVDFKYWNKCFFRKNWNRDLYQILWQIFLSGTRSAMWQWTTSWLHSGGISSDVFHHCWMWKYRWNVNDKKTIWEIFVWHIRAMVSFTKNYISLQINWRKQFSFHFFWYARCPKCEQEAM